MGLQTSLYIVLKQQRGVLYPHKWQGYASRALFVPHWTALCSPQPHVLFWLLPVPSSAALPLPSPPLQHERSYQKQVGVNINKNVNLKIKGDKKKARFYKDIGLGFKTPKEAIEGTYIDKKCPFTSTVSIRGRILKGIVRSTKMRRTIVIRRDYLHFIPKMSRYEKRHVTLAAHASPAFRVNEGDAVIVGECRPLSKTVSFNLVKIEKAGPSQDSLKSFAGF